MIVSDNDTDLFSSRQVYSAFGMIPPRLVLVVHRYNSHDEDKMRPLKISRRMRVGFRSFQRPFAGLRNSATLMVRVSCRDIFHSSSVNMLAGASISEYHYLPKRSCNRKKLLIACHV